MFSGLLLGHALQQPVASDLLSHIPSGEQILGHVTKEIDNLGDIPSERLAVIQLPVHNSHFIHSNIVRNQFVGYALETGFFVLISRWQNGNPTMSVRKFWHPECKVQLHLTCRDYSFWLCRANTLEDRIE